jgi:hypothetical protein
MPRAANPLKQLAETIAQLQERRRKLLAELAEIDEMFAVCGLQPQERRGPGRPPGRPKAAATGASTAAAAPKARRRGRGRKRGKFPLSAADSILAFLKSKGEKGATTADINKHWKSEGRKGSAYVSLGLLVKQKKVHREDLKGARGSRYTLAS